ncbi:hypothetical protein R5R35_004467 [Gryllus longicercus]|uniref:Uncharacterized protein n=1 Tax=Gryllus longicercus TaxID=2509291 RepID=A0AAN9VBQ2_9ORTH
MPKQFPTHQQHKCSCGSCFRVACKHQWNAHITLSPKARQVMGNGQLIKVKTILYITTESLSLCKLGGVSFEKNIKGECNLLFTFILPYSIPTMILKIYIAQIINSEKEF